MALRWGIVSAGKISHDFVTALSTLSSLEHQVVAVATGSDLNRAQNFAKLHEIPKAYGSYGELAQDPDVDVAYIGVINPLHYETCILMLDNGKHILCEKPLCMNEKQVTQLTNYAKKKNRFLMEAVWSRFLPSYQYLKEQILSGKLGEIEEMNVSFGFELSKVERLTKKSLGGGTTLDIGIYAIQLSQWVFRQSPENITARGELNDDGVDVEIEAKLTYPNCGITTIKLNALKQLDNVATIKGTKGQITLNAFWSSNSLIDVDGTERTWQLPKPKHPTNFINSVGLHYQAEEVRKCIQANKLESDDMSHAESLLLARLEDDIRRQVGVKYPEDD